MRAGAAWLPHGLSNLPYLEDSHLHPLYGNTNLSFTTSQGGKMTDLRDTNFSGFNDAMSLPKFLCWSPPPLPVLQNVTLFGNRMLQMLLVKMQSYME